MINTPFFADVLKKFNGKIANPAETFKWIMYSGHDLDIMAFLAGLNITNYQCIYDLYFMGGTDFTTCYPDYPSFASNLLLELYQDSATSDYYVQLAYQGEYVYLCEKEDIKCSWEEFSQRLANYILPNFERVCQEGPSDTDIEAIENEFEEVARRYAMDFEKREGKGKQVEESKTEEELSELSPGEKVESQGDKNSVASMNNALGFLALVQIGGIGMLGYKLWNKQKQLWR